MIKAFYATRQWALWAYGGGLLLISSLWLQVQMTVALNTWYGQFYDLLQNAASYKDNSSEGIALFLSKLISISYVHNGFDGEPSFIVIAFPYILLAIFTAWFTRVYGLRWREAITLITCLAGAVSSKRLRAHPSVFRRTVTDLLGSSNLLDCRLFVQS